MEDECLAVRHSNQIGQIGLRLANVDEGTSGVPKDQELGEKVQIYARWLNTARLQGFDLDPPLVKLFADRSVAQDHAQRAPSEKSTRPGALRSPQARPYSSVPWHGSLSWSCSGL